jgi:hypothetical protein
MANPLYTAFGNGYQDPQISAFMNQVSELQKTFKGDPRAEVEKMLRTGQLSQAQFNQYAQTANRIMAMMGKK